jgi:hypothetical protein
MTDRTNIQVSRRTHLDLGILGMKKQTFDDVVRDLLDFAAVYQDEFYRWRAER